MAEITTFGKKDHNPYNVKALGIDVGGSGIKGAPVDLKKGQLLDERHRIPTPNPSTPQALAKVIKELVDHFEWDGYIGCGFPAPIQRGIAVRASNIDKQWIGTHVENLISDATGLPVKVVNDADAAALAEMKFGAGADQDGLVFLVTVGTGLGTALFTEGHLVPNTELGHIILPEHGEAEPYASDATKKRLDLSWEEWAHRFNLYLQEIESLFYPDLIIVGGGTSKRFEKFSDLISTTCPVVPAQLLNNAGIIGGALAAKALKKKLRV